MSHHSKINAVATEVTSTECKANQLDVTIPVPVSTIVHGWHLKEGNIILNVK